MTAVRKALGAALMLFGSLILGIFIGALGAGYSPGLGVSKTDLAASYHCKQWPD